MSRLIADYGIYQIRYPEHSGGKAGKGHNKTSTIQVWKDGMFVVKQFRYTRGDAESHNAAINKAKNYCQQQTTQP